MNILSPDKQYKTTGNLTYSCQYHVIFCSKYRRPVLTNGADERVKELFYNIADQYEFSILEMDVMPDYVHMIIDCNPKFGIYNCIKKLKGCTSKQIFEEFPKIKTALPTLWTRKSFISSIGTVSIEAVQQYIYSQKGV